MRVLARFAVLRLRVAAAFFAAVEREAAFRLRVAAPFFAAADRVREVVDFFAAVVRLRVPVDRLAVVLDEADLDDVDLLAAAAFLAPRFDGVVSFFLPRPEPLFFPPPSWALTVA